MATKKNPFMEEKRLPFQPNPLPVSESNPKGVDFTGQIVNPPTPKPEPIKTNNVLRNESGQITGIQVKDKMFLGLGPDDVEKIAQGELRKTQGGPSTQQFEQQGAKQQAQAQQEQILQQNAQLANQVTQTPITQTTPTDLSGKEAALAGTRGAIPSILTNVGTGAAIGAGVGAGAGLGIGAIPGAVIGGVIGLAKSVYQGVTGNLEQQAGEVISNQNKVLTDGKRNLNKLIALSKADPARAPQYLTAYQEQKQLIADARAQLKLDTQRSSFKFLGKEGKKVLQGFENFYAPGGLNEIYDTQMQLAILGKNIDTTDLMMLSQEDIIE